MARISLVRTLRIRFLQSTKQLIGLCLTSFDPSLCAVFLFLLLQRSLIIEGTTWRETAVLFTGGQSELWGNQPFHRGVSQSAMGPPQVGRHVCYRCLNQLFCFCRAASVCSCLGSVQNPRFPTRQRAERRKTAGVARLLRVLLGFLDYFSDYVNFRECSAGGTCAQFDMGNFPKTFRSPCIVMTHFPLVLHQTWIRTKVHEVRKTLHLPEHLQHVGRRIRGSEDRAKQSNKSKNPGDRCLEFIFVWMI